FDRKPVYCFGSRAEGRRPAALVLLAQKDAETVSVSNIIPATRHQLPFGDYNYILEECYERLLRAAAERAGSPATLSSHALVLDTCILLDVIRAPIRPDKRCGCVKAAGELLRVVVPPQEATLVVGSFVSTEWTTHAGPTTHDLKKHLSRLDEWATAFHYAD